MAKLKAQRLAGTDPDSGITFEEACRLDAGQQVEYRGGRHTIIDQSLRMTDAHQIVFFRLLAEEDGRIVGPVPHHFVTRIEGARRAA